MTNFIRASSRRTLKTPVYSSIKLGLKCISPYSEGAVIIYGNRGVAATQDLKKILDTILSGALITIPERNGKRAHPVAFKKELFPELSDLRKEKGIPYILRKYNLHKLKQWKLANYP